MEREFLIGVEINSGEISAGIVDLNGKILKKVTNSINSKNSKKKFIETLVILLKKLKKENVLGIGIGISGFVDKKKGIVIESELSFLKNINLKQSIFQELHIPVFLENLVNCLALAEQRITFSRKVKHLINVSVDENIYMGVIINGKLYRGANNFVGKINRGPIENKKKYDCKNLGCLMQSSSLNVILDECKKITKKKRTIEEISEESKKNKKIKKVIDEAAKNFGIGLTNIINLLNPEVLVISGKVVKLNGFFETAKKEIEKRVHETTSRRTSIVLSDLNNAGILGASSIIMNEEE